MARVGRRTFVCTVLAAALAAAALLLLPSRVSPADVGKLFEKPRASWEGVLSLWHLGGWRTAAGSRGGQLQRVAAAYEKSNPGLFIEIENLSAEQYAARLAAGRKPDLLTWPGGMIEAAELALAPMALAPALTADLAAAVPYRDGGALALPWIRGGEAVLINAEMAATRGAELPAGDRWTAEEMLTLAGALMHKKGRTGSIQVYGLAAAGDGLLSFALPGRTALDASVLDPGAQTLWQAWESFAGGRAGMLLGSQWEVAAMERLREQGKGFEFRVMPVPDDLCQAAGVQWIAVADSGDAGRTAAAQGFVEELLTPENQKIISRDTGCLSVLRDGSDAGILNLLLNPPAAPVIFPSPLDALPDSIVRQAALGDAAARQTVASRSFSTDSACENTGNDVE